MTDVDWQDLQALARQTAGALAAAGVPTQPVHDSHGWVVHEHCAWLEEKDYSRRPDHALLSREETGYETFLLTREGRLYYEVRTELLIVRRNGPTERMLRDQSTSECGPDDLWRLDVSSGGPGPRRSFEDGVEITRAGWHRMRGGPDVHAVRGAGLRQALTELPRRPYTGGSRENFYAWMATHAARPVQPSISPSGLSRNQIYLIAIGLVLVAVLGTCGFCVFGGLILANSN